MKQSKVWLIPFFVCGLFYYPVIANNLMYMDDTFRAISGFDGWGVSGRPLADFIMHRLMMKSSYLIGYGQLGQLLSVSIMAITSLIIAKKLFAGDGWHKYFLCSGFALNPFFLENMSYQYDSLTMTISLCLSVIAAVIVWEKGVYYFFGAVALITAASSLYQTSLNSYIGFFAASVIIKTASNYASPKSLFLACIKGALAAALATLAYMLIIRIAIPMTNDRGNMLSVSSGYIEYFFSLSLRAYSLLVNTLSYKFSFIALLFMIITAITGVIKNDDKLVRLALVIISSFVVYFSMVGIISLIRDQYISSRILMGGSAITFLFFALAGLYFVPKWASVSASIIVMLPLFLVSYSYGFAAKYQREHDTANINFAINDIRNDDKFDQKSYIVFSGKMPVAPVVSHTVQKFDLVSLMLMPSYDWTASMIAQSWGVSGVRFNFARAEQKETVALVCKKGAPKISETNSYAIYRNGDKNGYLVWMKGAKKNPC
ncbi:MAG: glucosyltransferase domain-containing protein [Pantoea sp.]|nr:glucosyltransferase domain-containing protein [Pantoea sp.]